MRGDHVRQPNCCSDIVSDGDEDSDTSDCDSIAARIVTTCRYEGNCHSHELIQAVPCNEAKKE